MIVCDKYGKQLEANDLVSTNALVGTYRRFEDDEPVGAVTNGDYAGQIVVEVDSEEMRFPVYVAGSVNFSPDVRRVETAELGLKGTEDPL